MNEITHAADDTATEAVPVLIVGGSLVGLSAAVFLSWHGVPVVLVDKHHGSSPHPRAIGFTTRTVEHFRQVGVDVPPSLQGMKPPRRARVESLTGTWLEEYPWTPGGEGAYGAEYSPVHAIAITQDRLEPLLRDRSAELGADLRPGTELIGFVRDDDGVTATLRRRDDGHEYRLRARYVVAADGATSAMREKLGIARHGAGPLSVQRSILFRAPLDEYLRHGVVQFEIEQPGLKAFLTTYSDGRWVLMLSDDVERDADEQRRVVQQAVGRTDIPIELVTTGRWDLAGLIADRFFAGRVFLVGDAAHQLPPNRGGFGANTGIDDAHNLAWKLAAVLAGRSEPRLLDTYDAERRPVADLRHDQLFARADYKAYLTAPEQTCRCSTTRPSNSASSTARPRCWARTPTCRPRDDRRSGPANPAPGPRICGSPSTARSARRWICSGATGCCCPRTSTGPPPRPVPPSGRASPSRSYASAPTRIRWSPTPSVPPTASNPPGPP